MKLILGGSWWNTRRWYSRQSGTINTTPSWNLRQSGIINTTQSLNLRQSGIINTTPSWNLRQSGIINTTPSWNLKTELVDIHRYVKKTMILAYINISQYISLFSVSDTSIQLLQLSQIRKSYTSQFDLNQNKLYIQKLFMAQIDSNQKMQ